MLIVILWQTSRRLTIFGGLVVLRSLLLWLPLLVLSELLKQQLSGYFAAELISVDSATLSVWYYVNVLGSRHCPSSLALKNYRGPPFAERAPSSRFLFFPNVG